MTILPLPPDCIQTIFIQRYKRFSVQVAYRDQTFWIHSNNSGSMLGLARPGSLILASPAHNPKRKLAYTQEAIWLDDFWVGVNTAVPNKMLAAAFANQELGFAASYSSFTPEAKYGQSRIDALFQASNQPKLWVECKNVTLVEDEIAMFPDAITTRGQKHLQELMHLVSQGQRAANFYLVQRPDAKCFSPADFIDPVYAELFWQAVDIGVEMYPMVAKVTPQGISLGQTLPLRRL